MNQDALVNLTLENFSTVTGKRFRMSKAQKERGLTREEAFTEWKTIAATTLTEVQNASGS